MVQWLARSFSTDRQRDMNILLLYYLNKTHCNTCEITKRIDVRTRLVTFGVMGVSKTMAR